MDKTLQAGLSVGMSAASGFHSKKPNRVDPEHAGKNILPASFCPEPNSRVSFPSAKHTVSASYICIGAWPWGDKATWHWDESQLPAVKEAWKTLYNAGINFIDTAESYGSGESEMIVGELVEGLPRDSFVIQTKYFSTPLKGTNFIRPIDAPLISLKSSLQRMKLDYVDIYLVHGPIHVQSISQIAEGMAQCVEQGLARAIGVANYDVEDVEKMNDELAKYNIPLATNQCEFNVLRRYPELTGNISTCQKSGMIFQSYSSLAQGRLSGKYTAKNPPPKEYRFSSYKMEDLEPVLKTLGQIAERRGKSVAAVALNYNLSKGVLPVVGIRNVEQAKCAIEALGWRLTEAEMVDIDKTPEEAEIFANLRNSEQQRRVESEVISLLRSLPRAQATEMLQRLRDNADLPTVLSSVQWNTNFTMRPSDLRSARAIAPPTGSATEFELTAQCNTAYPKILPVDMPSLMGLLQKSNSDQRMPVLSNIANPPPSTSRSHSQSLRQVEPEHGSAASQALMPVSGKRCDSRLEKLQISYWTKVPVSNEVAASLISFYIGTDHKIMGFFDADLFLQDLVECRQRFCSSFLVNSVLCLACQGYAAIKPQTNDIRLAAFKEAEMLFRGEGSDKSLLSLAAMGLFSAACIFEGKDELGQQLAASVRQEAEQLGLFGGPMNCSNTTTLHLESPEWVRATSQIAWGAYNWLTIHVIFYHHKPIRFPPTLPIPGAPRNRDMAVSSCTAYPPHLGTTFPNTCRLWTVVQEVLGVYVYPDEKPISERVPLAFAEGKYRKLLEWASTLGNDMKRTEHCASDVIIFHIMFHVVVTIIFRPFIGTPQSPRLMSFMSTDSHPKAVYAASVNQLKDLVFSYRAHYPEASFTSFFNPGLFTLSLALLEDLQDPLWRYYFYLCVRCWQDLYFCYPVFRDVAKAFLSMAMQKDAIAAREAQDLLREIEQSGQHHTTAAEAFTSFIFDPASDRAREAQVHAMADTFEEMVIFDELIDRDHAYFE
ncbi:hypothetical protein ACHAPT_012103 [Fusarium lateritium]